MQQRLSAEKDNTFDDLNIETDAQQPQDALDEALVREFLSAKNLKSMRSDSTRRSSNCFGRRMDRIGSMSSLGCNSVGKSSKLTINPIVSNGAVLKHWKK